MERESIPAGVGFALAFVNRGEMSEKNNLLRLKGKGLATASRQSKEVIFQ